jgi:hypothetical protein
VYLFIYFHWGDPGVDGRLIFSGFQEVGSEGIDWIELAQNRDTWRALVNAVMKFRVPKNVGNFLTSCKPVSFPGRTLLHGVSKYLFIYYSEFTYFAFIKSEDPN